MKDKDKEVLARSLWGMGGLVRVPLVRPLSGSWTHSSDSPMAECHVCTLDFHSKTVTVRVPVAELGFDEIRRLWEMIVLYGEVA